MKDYLYLHAQLLIYLTPLHCLSQSDLPTSYNVFTDQPQRPYCSLRSSQVLIPVQPLTAILSPTVRCGPFKEHVHSKDRVTSHHLLDWLFSSLPRILTSYLLPDLHTASPPDFACSVAPWKSRVQAQPARRHQPQAQPARSHAEARMLQPRSDDV